MRNGGLIMGFAERENKRKQSVVESMISEPLEKSDVQAAPQNIIITPKVKIETRSKRVNLLITPSVYAEAQKKCKKLGISLNECINQFLTNWVHKM